MLQDANYNVVALVNETGQVLEQYTWQPYGTLAAIDTNATPAPDNRIGHQGLFYYRLDGSTTFATNATGLYYNRNRWYSPHLGRFTSRDPNETGMLLVGVLAINGQALQSLVSAFSPEGHFADGINLYVYLNSNPITGADPLGLYDPFAEVDAWQEDRAANALYTVGTLNAGAMLGLNTSLEIASVLLGLDVFESVTVLLSGKGGFWDAMNIVLSVNPIGRLGKAGGRIVKASRWMNKASKVVTKLVRHHTVPKAVLKKLRSDVASSGLVRGKKGAPNIWKIPEDIHKMIHKGPRGGHWNASWWKELDSLGGPESAEVEDIVHIRNKLVSEFGLGEYRP